MNSTKISKPFVCSRPAVNDGHANSDENIADLIINKKIDALKELLSSPEAVSVLLTPVKHTYKPAFGSSVNRLPPHLRPRDLYPLTYAVSDKYRSAFGKDYRDTDSDEYKIAKVVIDSMRKYKDSLPVLSRCPNNIDSFSEEVMSYYSMRHNVQILRFLHELGIVVNTSFIDLFEGRKRNFFFESYTNRKGVTDEVNLDAEAPYFLYMKDTNLFSIGNFVNGVLTQYDELMDFIYDTFGTGEPVITCDSIFGETTAFIARAQRTEDPVEKTLCYKRATDRFRHFVYTQHSVDILTSMMNNNNTSFYYQSRGHSSARQNLSGEGYEILCRSFYTSPNMPRSVLKYIVKNQHYAPIFRKYRLNFACVLKLASERDLSEMTSDEQRCIWRLSKTTYPVLMHILGYLFAL